MCQGGLTTWTLELDGGLCFLLNPCKLICFHLEADRGTLPRELYTVLKRLCHAVIYVIDYSADGWHSQPDPCCIVFPLLGFCPAHPLLGSK